MKSRSATNGSRRPVLLVSGFGSIPPLPAILHDYRASGREAHVAPWTVLPMCSIETYGCAVAERACRLADNSIDGKLDLVCHSLGGVASLYAIKRLGLANRVANFIASGSPFKGTPTAWALLPTGIFTVTGFECLPDSCFLRNLHADPLPDGPRFISFSGCLDIVCPPDRTKLAGAENVSLDHHHWNFLTDRRFHVIIRARYLP